MENPQATVNIMVELVVLADPEVGVDVCFLLELVHHGQELEEPEDLMAEMVEMVNIILLIMDREPLLTMALDREQQQKNSDLQTEHFIPEVAEGVNTKFLEVMPDPEVGVEELLDLEQPCIYILPQDQMDMEEAEAEEYFHQIFL